MKLMTQVIASVEIIHVPDSATSDQIFNNAVPWVEPDFTAAIAKLKEIEGVRKVEFIDNGNDTNPNRAGVEYDLKLTVQARQFVGEDFWQMSREEFKADGMPIVAYDIVSAQLGESAFDDELHDTIRACLGQEYDIEVHYNLTVKAAA